MKTRIAVIGSGYWGKNLVRNFYELGALALVCDKNEQALHAFQKQYPGIETCLAFNDVLHNTAVDAVVIATPAQTHYTLANEALLAGKHVFVEKPLALADHEAQALTDTAARQGVQLMVGHLLEYHPCFITLREMAEAGELGRIDYIYSHRLNLGKIRREENILWSFAPHDISMILSLTKEMPDKVHCHGGAYLHSRIADVTTTHLHFPAGTRAHIFVSWLHPFKEQKLVVVGNKKMAVFNDTLSWDEKLTIYPHTINWQGQVPVPDKAQSQLINVEQKEPLREECLHFLDCIADNSPPHTDGRQGINVLKVLNASQKSLDQEGKEYTPDKTKQAETATHSPDTTIHETAIIDSGVQIGKGTAIWHFSHVLKNSRIGDDCTVGQNVMIGPDVHIGNGCKIQNNVSVYQGVSLEKEVFCGPSMVFTNVVNPRAHMSKMNQARPTLVKQGATLGANCTVICGNTIGRYALVGAGAVVTKDVLDHAMVLGNPARPVGWVCMCNEKLDENLTCPVCALAYQKTQNGLMPL